MAVREFGSWASFVAVGRNLFIGNLYYCLWSASPSAGVGLVRTAALGASVGDRVGLLCPDTDTVWDGAGDLYVVGDGAGEFGARV